VRRLRSLNPSAALAPRAAGGELTGR
jgi:hypothetical protein